MQKSKPSIVALISGRGSNLGAIIEYAKQTGEFDIKAVISNRPHVAGLDLASANGIQTVVIDHKHFDSREAFDARLKAEIKEFSPNLVVLAGFMRVLTAGFVHAFAGRLVNIHPSLLPAFPGLHTHQQALDAGVRVHGVTVHLVTPVLDYGPILDQAVLAIRPEDTAETLAARVLVLEHQIYPRAIAGLLNGSLVIGENAIQGALAQPLVQDVVELGNQ